MIRSLTFCVALSATAVSAQVPTVYLLQATAELSDAQRKWATHALLELDQRAVISFEGVFLKARISGANSSSAVVNALQAVGLTCALVTEPQTTSPEQAEFPVLLHTGDSAADEERYKAAKEAWILAHPAAYGAMMDQSGGAPPATKEP